MIKKIIILSIAIIFIVSVFGKEIVKDRLSDSEIVTGQLSLPPNNDSIPLLVVFLYGTESNNCLNSQKKGIIELMKVYQKSLDRFNAIFSKIHNANRN